MNKSSKVNVAHYKQGVEKKKQEIFIIFVTYAVVQKQTLIIKGLHDDPFLKCIHCNEYSDDIYQA